MSDRKYVEFTINRLKTIKEKYGYINALEIGPGKGALTKYLVSIFDNLYLFEKDTTFTDILGGIVPLENIVFGDVLEADIDSLVKDRKLNVDNVAVIGNIPYYITSPILRKFFENTNFTYGIFMIQKEVGEKIKTDAEKKSYLWWLLNYGYDVKYLKTVPAKAFSPAPKVDSCLVELKAKSEKLTINWNSLIEVLDNISMYKRKTLGKIWKMVKAKNEKFHYNLPENIEKMRLEDIGWDEMTQIIGK